MLFLSRQINFSPREKCWPYPSREIVPQCKNVGLIIVENLFPNGKMLALSWQRIRSPREKRPYPSREFIPQGKNVGLIIAENLFPQGKNVLIPADKFFPQEKNVGLIPAENSFPHGKMLFLADNLFPQGKNVFIPVENVSPGGFFVVALIPVEKVFPMGKPGWFPPSPPPPRWLLWGHATYSADEILPKQWFYLCCRIFNMAHTYPPVSFQGLSAELTTLRPWGLRGGGGGG